MSEIEFALLPEALRPLLNKFYREHQSPMRAANKGEAWVARQQDVLGALCLTSVDDGHWLSSLFVAPHSRGRGIAGQLIAAATQAKPGPVWLFCHPELTGFYESLGYGKAERLPATLGERFMRYSRSKPLVALCRS